jgi:hypothetical protein
MNNDAMTVTMAEDVLGVKERQCVVKLGQEKAKPQPTMQSEAWSARQNGF